MASYTNGMDGQRELWMGRARRERELKEARVAAGLPEKETRQETADRALAAWESAHKELQLLHTQVAPLDAALREAEFWLRLANRKEKYDCKAAVQTALKAVRLNEEKLTKTQKLILSYADKRSYDAVTMGDFINK